jgi:hypothetical protein
MAPVSEKEIALRGDLQRFAYWSDGLLAGTPYQLVLSPAPRACSPTPAHSTHKPSEPI